MGGQKVFIIDDQIDRQELAFEFYFYKNLFESWGWECEICETTDFFKEGVFCGCGAGGLGLQPLYRFFL